jgi:competence protein ComEA
MQRLIIVILAIVVALPVVIKSRESRIKSASAAFSITSSPKVLVRVSGDIDRPGIFQVNANTMTIGVINMAMDGAPQKYRIMNESGAKVVANGTDLHIKRQSDGSALIGVIPMPASERMVMGIPLDINTMSKADFVRLPGIGPVMAERIIVYRQINGGIMRVEDFLAVEGIGEVKYKKLSKYF